jgi:hypothetical protein
MATPNNVTPPDSRTPVLNSDNTFTRPIWRWLTRIVSYGVTHLSGALVKNQIIVGTGANQGSDVASLPATADGQIPIGAAADGTVEMRTLTAGANISITDGPHSVTIAATGVVTGPAGSNTDIQYNDAGVFGGDANLTWDKTNRTETITGLSTESTLLIKIPGQPTANLGGNEQGLSLGTHETGGQEIAEIANIGYFAFDPAIAEAKMGLSIGETPGSPTTYANFTEWDVTERTAELTGDPVAGPIPGMAIGAQNNHSGSGAASTIFGEQRGGTRWYIWQDATGSMRYGPARPTEDNSVSDTSGFLFGSGSGASLPTICAITSLRA